MARLQLPAGVTTSINWYSMDRSLFDAVQEKLSAYQSHETLTRQKSDHLLRNLLFDDAGHPMIATYATKAGVRYRYYASQPSLHGDEDG